MTELTERTADAQAKAAGVWMVDSDKLGKDDTISQMTRRIAIATRNPEARKFEYHVWLMRSEMEKSVEAAGAIYIAKQDKLLVQLNSDQKKKWHTDKMANDAESNSTEAMMAALEDMMRMPRPRRKKKRKVAEFEAKLDSICA